MKKQLYKNIAAIIPYSIMLTVVAVCLIDNIMSEKSQFPDQSLTELPDD